MSRVEELIKEKCPDGVEYRKLEDILMYEQPTKYIVSSTEYDNSYPTPVLTAGQSFILGYTDEIDGVYKASKETPVIIFDDFTTSFHWVDFQFKVKSSAIKMLRPRDWDKCNFRYLYYAMCTIDYVPVEHSRQWISNYSQFEIPVPPIEIQQEIVRILDKFTKLEAELRSELEARKKQYEYAMDSLVANRTDMFDILVGEAFDIITDYTAAGSFADLAKNVVYSNSPDYAQLVRTMDIKSKFTKGAPVYVSENAFKYLWRVNLDSEAVILPNIGNCGEVYYVVPKDLPYENNVLGPNAILARSTKHNNRYLSYALQTAEFQRQLKKIISPAGQTKFNKTDLKKLTIKVPSIEEQEKIVELLDKFDRICNDLECGLPAEIEARHKQYEYYRDKLLTFKRKVV